MTYLDLIVALFTVAAPAPAAAPIAAQQKDLTLEQTSGHGVPRVSFNAQPPAWSFASDGVHLATQKEGKAVWVDPKTKAEREPPAADPAAAEREREVVAAFEKLPGFDEAAAKRVASQRRVRASDSDALLIESEGDLYFFRRGKEKATRLTFTAQPEENGELSADGRIASFVRENDLYLVETDGGRERQVTKDGGPEKLNGKLDWLYQEEVYGRGRWNATWWSPSSRHVAFLSLDQTGVPHHPIVDHMVDRAVLEDTRYPKSGDPNPTVALGIARARDGKVVWVNLGKYQGVEPIVVRVGWTPDGKKLWFQVQDRVQTWLDLNYADPDSGKVENLFRETSTTWVNVLADPRWLADGSFLWQSERTGYEHLYHYDKGGKLLKQVTDGPWQIASVDRVDEEKGLVWFTGQKDSAIASNAYRVGLDGTGLTRLTQGPGSHSVEWNGDRSLFLDRVSSVAFPTEVRLCNGGDGSQVEVLGKSEVEALKEYRYSRPELLKIPTRDGFEMDATLVKPPDFDAGRRYPIWLPTYSGPDAPSVADRWNGDAWTQFLAQQGYLVFQVNNRTSSRRGHEFIAKCYLQLGVQELADLEDALAWLGRNPWADTGRVGITGWSYGGFMSAFALTHSKAFKLGVAGAGVYDWKLYDTIYTERFMRTPQQNPDGYAKASCLEAAKDLSGHLVIAHGTLDDNVHFQNAVQLAMALQKAGKESFEVMLYPRSRHGLGSADQNWHFRRLMWKAIQERL